MYILAETQQLVKSCASLWQNTIVMPTLHVH